MASAVSSEHDDAALLAVVRSSSIREPGIAGYGFEQLAHACTIWRPAGIWASTSAIRPSRS